MDERFCKVDALGCAILGRHVAVLESLMNLDLGPAFTRAQAVVNGLVAAIPGLIVALVVFGGFLLVAAIVKGVVARLTETRLHTHRNAGVAVGRLAQGLVILLGLLVALSVALPTFRPGNVVQVLGIGSVAIGFAFRDILQNFLAGILLLVTSRFASAIRLSPAIMKARSRTFRPARRSSAPTMADASWSPTPSCSRIRSW
jgi:hypothetical protein